MQDLQRIRYVTKHPPCACRNTAGVLVAGQPLGIALRRHGAAHCCCGPAAALHRCIDAQINSRWWRSASVERGVHRRRVVRARAAGAHTEACAGGRIMNQFTTQLSLSNVRAVRRFTMNFGWLQGLTFVPIGVSFLVFAASNAGWWEWFRIRQPFSTIVGIYIAGGCSALILRYYMRTFGRVCFTPYKNRWLVAILLCLTCCIAGGIDSRGRPHTPEGLFADAPAQYISVGGLLAAALLLLYCWKIGIFRTFYAIMAILTAGVSVLPLSINVNANLLFGVLLPTLYGVCFVVGGILNHLLLVRTFKPVPGE